MVKFTLLTRKQRILLICLTIGIIFSIIYAAFRNNIHTVIPGKVYRSAQLGPGSLQNLVKLKGIKTIINLRGTNAGEKWYQKEIKTAHLLHLNHYDIALNSTQLPTSAQLEKLSTLLKNAPRPILLHCASGIDRTGFASALALVVINHAPINLAEMQFSWHYLVTSNNSIGKLVFRKYHHWVTQRKLPVNSRTFQSWVDSQKSGRDSTNTKRNFSLL